MEIYFYTILPILIISLSLYRHYTLKDEDLGILVITLWYTFMIGFTSTFLYGMYSDNFYPSFYYLVTCMVLVYLKLLFLL